METTFDRLISDDAVVVGIDHLQGPVPHAGLLAGGGVHAVVTAAGSGFVAFGERDLTRWRGDRVTDDDGVFFYLRELDPGSESGAGFGEVWSAGYQPTRRLPERYEARFGPGVVEIERLDGGIETRMAVCAAPDAPTELRCLTLTNRSERPRRIEVTSYVELVLHHRAADASHPAFSKLFVQTEKLEDRPVLLARRRPRSSDDAPIWAAHFTDAGDGLTGWETDRLRFLGRGRNRTSPRALDPDAELSGTTGNVLDPLFSLRRVVELAPEASAELVFGLAGGENRDAVLAAAERFAEPTSVRAAFAAARAHAEEQHAALNLSAEEAQRCDEWAGALLYGSPALRAPEAVLRDIRSPLSALGELKVSATDPLVVARIERTEEVETVRALLRATAGWRQCGLPVVLVVLAAAEVREEVDAAVADGGDEVHVRTLGDVDPKLIALIEGTARIHVAGTLPEASTPSPSHALPPPPSSPSTPAHSPALSPRDLQHFNGFGGFSAGGSEYVIHVGPDGAGGLRVPPLPWVNVVANEQAGFLVSERGAVHTWAANSRENRLTPWSNDPVSDPHGEALYLRDEDTGEFWSPTPGPIPRLASYEVRHGWGATTFRHTSGGIEQTVTYFVPRHDPVRIALVRLTNHGDATRRLTLFSYARLVLGDDSERDGRFVITEAAGNVLLARNPTAAEFADGVAFAAAVGSEERVSETASFTTDRAAFLGRHGSPETPRALRDASLRTDAPLDGATGAGLDPCFALAVPLEIGAGETVEVAFLLGQTESREAALDLVAQYRESGVVQAALDEVHAFWNETLSAVEIDTPAPELDVLVNGWLLYQDLSCRMWGRTAFYQSGGAFGFRDQIQDSTALVYTRPDLLRAQLLLHAAHQFEEGDVLHWWHPPTSKGIRTHFSDDLLWLPYATAFYVETTGDVGVLDETARYLTARELKEGEDEVFLTPEDAGTSGTLFDHCCRALDRSLTAGAHGLPLMGTGDWNDGMNSVGDEGRGESVWLGFFLAHILQHFLPLCDMRGETERAATYRAYLADLETALNDAGWDGGWYRRAYYDDGTPLGSAQNDECRIDAIAQGWSVISGVAPPERAAAALDAAEEHLVREEEGLIRLLTPPFDKTEHDPGYIKGYVPGVRENGGQYTHGVLWLIRAFAEQGRTDLAARLLTVLSPVHHTRTAEAAERYKTEPYVVAADVYSVAPHVGRGGWTWYTGSAGWTYRVALESILGFRVENGDTLVLDPRIPADWPGFSLRYRLPNDGGTVEIEVMRGEAAEATFDGIPVAVTDGAVRVLLPHDGASHRLTLTLAS